MSKIVELYVRELPREQVEDAIAAIEAAANAGTAKEGASE